MIFSVFQKNWVFCYSWFTLLWYWCYYPHRSRDALSPVCGIFFEDIKIVATPLYSTILCKVQQAGLSAQCSDSSIKRTVYSVPCLVFSVQFQFSVFSLAGTVCRVHCEVYSVQYSVFSVQCLVCSDLCSVCSVQFGVFGVKCTVMGQVTVYSAQFTVYSVQCTVYSVQCTVYNVQCTVISVQ